MSSTNGISPAAFSQLPALTPTNAVIALGSVVIVALVLKSLCNQQKEPQSSVPALAGRTQPYAAALQVSEQGLQPSTVNIPPVAPGSYSGNGAAGSASSAESTTPRSGGRRGDDAAARQVVDRFGASPDADKFMQNLTASLTPPSSQSGVKTDPVPGRNAKRKKAE